MPAYDPRDRGEVEAAKGNAGYGGGGGGRVGGGATGGAANDFGSLLGSIFGGPGASVGVGGGIQGNVSGRDRLGNPLPQPAAAAAPAAGAPAPTLTGQAAWDQIMGKASAQANESALYYLVQSGILPPGTTKVPAQYQSLVDREMERIFGTNAMGQYITPDMLSDKNISNTELQQAQTRALAAVPQTFGQQMINAENQRLQNANTQALNAFKWNPRIQSAFGESSDDEVINSILQEQYNNALNVINNQRSRGVLTDAGLNNAMQQLGTQNTAGLGTLNTLGQQQRDAAARGLTDYTTGIYNTAGSSGLGQSFDPNQYNREFGNRLGTAVSGLGTSIREAAPTNLFDIDTIQRNAGIAQGMTSGGSLLDTMAGRNTGRNTQNRGIGSQGAF